MIRFKIRKGKESDIDAILDLKSSLRLVDTSQGQEGGFLLGCSKENYQSAIQNSSLLVLTDRDDNVCGFSLWLSDADFRKHEVWEKRHLISGNHLSMKALEQEKLCYFDQLAVANSPGARRYAVFLAIKTMTEVIKHHDHVFTTTILEPMTNKAAWSFLEKSGGKPIGVISEVYENIGHIRSRIFHIRKEDFFIRLDTKFRNSSRFRNKCADLGVDHTPLM